MEHPPAAGIDERTAKNRFSSEEARAFDRMHNDIYNEARQAAEAHRQTRKHIMKWVCKRLGNNYGKGRSEIICIKT